ncbi:hypothetical protein [Pseudofrankia asymbiotica]|uniref:Uncharacterized protein n=1 Tax=Pseudofrankia asymbiotica TaxID=1834516 RepID=A0A1V2I3W3_9ACTN|nr:hypothetical protein [Pseudofrankia asymbiotica]ONH23833.1 hypothetical protein BL253_31950 [Pseudofrankia asymbiotica]
MSRVAMTKTEARKVARQARQYGYQADLYHRNGSVRCPRCEQRIGATRYENHWSDAGQVRLLIAALDKAVISHLTSEYDDERCPRVGAR